MVIRFEKGTNQMKQVYELREEIKKGLVPKVNIFTGEESFVLNHYINKVIELDFTLIYSDSVSQQVKSRGKKSFVKSSKCYVITNDAEFLKADKYWDSVFEQFEKGDDVLILKYLSLDRRSTFFKKYQDIIVDFELMDFPVIQARLIKQLPNTKVDLINELIIACENNYNLIQLELDKVIRYSKEKNKSLNESFIDLFNSNTILISKQLELNNFVEYALKRDIHNYLNYIETFKSKEDSPLGLLTILYNSFRNLLMVQGLGNDRSDASNRTGLQYWQVRHIERYIGYYTNQELISAIRLIHDYDTSIKNGSLPQEEVLKLILFEIIY